MRQIENKWKDHRLKPNNIKNHIKYKWSKYFSYKSETLRID